jgi:hypothetical protein
MTTKDILKKLRLLIVTKPPQVQKIEKTEIIDDAIVEIPKITGFLVIQKKVNRKEFIVYYMPQLIQLRRLTQ